MKKTDKIIKIINKSYHNKNKKSGNHDKIYKSYKNTIKYTIK